MILATLLPGIREIRTPLIAGYVWLVALSLIVWPHVRRADLPSSAQSLVAGDSAWHTAVIGSAITFAALLLGLLGEGLYDLGIRFAVRRALPANPVHGFLGGWRNLLARFESTLSRLRSGPTKIGLRSLNLAASEAVRDAERRLESSTYNLRDLVLLLGFVRGRSDRPPGDEERRRLRSELDRVETARVRESLRAWLVIRIIDQLDLLARRLVSDNPGLFSDYDRLRTEAQFRTAITPPLFVLTITLAVIWTPWVAFAVIGLPILVRQAIRRGDQASDLLIDAMLIGKAEPPAFEQLSRMAAQLADE